MEGKTISTTGAYTIHATLPMETEAHIQYLLQKRGQRKFLFPAGTQATVAKALKEYGFEIRSIRRGAAQAMALAGHTPQTIRLFTRHKDEKGLSAYLDAGLVARWDALQMTATRTALFPWM